MPAAPKIVLLENPAIACTLKKVRRSRSLRISVRQDGRVVVTAPYGETFQAMERFLRQQQKWLAKQLSRITQAPRLVPRGGARHYRAHREQAAAYIHETLERLNRQYGFSYKRVSIRNQATRWGSCSQHGSLNFNYKLLFLPQELADYVIVHELCHLAELNHSARFWELVSQTIPNYRAHRRTLRNQLT